MGTSTIDMEAKAKVGRKPTGSGPRSIATLNAEQLARKRAVDRACQRTLRQKKRERTRQLEGRVRELLGDFADEYQAAEQRGRELEKELKRLRALVDEHKADVVDEPLPINISPSLARVIPKLEYCIDEPSLLSRATSAAVSSPSTIASLPLEADISSGELSVHAESDGTVEVASTLLITKPPEERKVTISLIKQPCIHVWEIPPAINKPATPVEKILYGMVAHQRKLFTNNKSLTGAELAGPRIPDLSLLIAPERFGSRPVHTVSRVISELLYRITYRTFVEKIAGFVIMYPIYQWLIMNNSETYYNLAPWMLPVEQQRTTPHPVWISALGLPRLREVVIENLERYDTEEFQFLFVANLNCNWPHGVEAALSWEDGGVTVSKVFWDHCRDMKNWSLDEPFLRRYPELKDIIPCTKYPDKSSRITELHF